MIASDTLFQLDFFLGRIDSDYIKYLYEADRFHHVYYKEEKGHYKVFFFYKNKKKQK